MDINKGKVTLRINIDVNYIVNTIITDGEPRVVIDIDSIEVNPVEGNDGH